MDETMQTYESAVDAPSVAENAGDREHVRYLTDDEGKHLFDEAVRREMGISGEEFLRRWDAGEWRDDPDHEPIMGLLFLMPFAR